MEDISWLWGEYSAQAQAICWQLEQSLNWLVLFLCGQFKFVQKAMVKIQCNVDFCSEWNIWLCQSCNLIGMQKFLCGLSFGPRFSPKVIRPFFLAEGGVREHNYMHLSCLKGGPFRSTGFRFATTIHHSFVKSMKWCAHMRPRCSLRLVGILGCVQGTLPRSEEKRLWNSSSWRSRDTGQQHSM